MIEYIGPILATWLARKIGVTPGEVEGFFGIPEGKEISHIGGDVIDIAEYDEEEDGVDEEQGKRRTFGF